MLSNRTVQSEVGVRTQYSPFQPSYAQGSPEGSSTVPITPLEEHLKTTYLTL